MLLAVGPVLVALASATPARLTDAEARGDLDEVSRLAGQAGAAEIAPMLADPDRAVAVAGIAAAPDAPDAWELLEPLATLAGGWDRSLAAPAARAGARIAQHLDADAAIAGDMPDDALGAREDAWAAIGARADRWSDVRVLALEIASRLAGARTATADAAPGLGYDLATLLADPDPEVRRAGCELVPQPTAPALRPALAAAIAHDADPIVAVACAQTLCADLAFDPPEGALAALGADGDARLRALLGDRTGPPAAPAGALVDAARCLAAGASRDDRAALAALIAHAPRQARAMIQRASRKRP